MPATGADAWFGSVGGAREPPPQPGEPPQVADLLEQVVTSGGRLVGAADVLVYLVEHDAHGGQRLIVRHGAGCFATSVARSVGKGEGLAGEVWRIGAPLAVGDYQSWPGRLWGARGEDGIGGALAVPLHSHGVVVGVLGLASRRPGRGFGQAEIELLCRFGEVAGAAIDNAVRLAAARRELAEQAMREALEREQQATRQLRALDEAKNVFLSAVSHELRTPLAAIVGIALTLQRARSSLAEDDGADLVNRLAANAGKLDRLLSDLLDLDRLNRGIVTPKLRPTDLAALVTRIGTEWQDPGRPLKLAVEPVVAQVDPAKVERIVENLLANAARHTPPDTPVWVRVARQAQGVLIAVDDAGGGVPPQLRAALFEPFRQGPEAPTHAPGVGIGLTLVARFAELHGGRAWVEERPGGGSSFRVLLPDPPVAAAATAPPPQRHDGVAPPNIALEPLDFQEPPSGTNTNAS